MRIFLNIALSIHKIHDNEKYALFLPFSSKVSWSTLRRQSNGNRKASFTCGACLMHISF